jgi:hypothetical protein
MAEDHKDTQERALWAAVVALEEGASLDERLAPQLGVQSHTQARQKREHAQRIKEIIERVRERVDPETQEGARAPLKPASQ